MISKVTSLAGGAILVATGINHHNMENSLIKNNNDDNLNCSMNQVKKLFSPSFRRKSKETPASQINETSTNLTTIGQPRRSPKFVPKFSNGIRISAGSTTNRVGVKQDKKRETQETEIPVMIHPAIHDKPNFQMGNSPVDDSFEAVDNRRSVYMDDQYIKKTQSLPHNFHQQRDSFLSSTLPRDNPQKLCSNQLTSPAASQIKAWQIEETQKTEKSNTLRSALKTNRVDVQQHNKKRVSFLDPVLRKYEIDNRLSEYRSYKPVRNRSGKSGLGLSTLNYPPRTQDGTTKKATVTSNPEVAKQIEDWERQQRKQPTFLTLYVDKRQPTGLTKVDNANTY